MQVFLIATPGATAIYLERIRDTLRLLFLFPHPKLSQVVSRLYSVVFYRAKDIPVLADRFHQFAMADFSAGKGLAKWDTSADPLLSKLNPFELHRVTLTTLTALASLRLRHLSLSIMAEVLPCLSSMDLKERLSAVELIHSLIGVAPLTERTR
jgi:hypothetical protein